MCLSALEFNEFLALVASPPYLTYKNKSRRDEFEQ